MRTGADVPVRANISFLLHLKPAISCLELGIVTMVIFQFDVEYRGFSRFFFFILLDLWQSKHIHRKVRFPNTVSDRYNGIIYYTIHEI